MPMATEVKALLLQIDASVELLKRNLASGDAQIAAFERKTNEHLTNVQLAFKKMDMAAEASVAVFSKLSAGLSSLGLILPTIAFAEMAKTSLEYAAGLKTTADRVGVTVEQLQVMRKAARDAGVEQGVLETALARLNIKLGQAKAGLDPAIKAFQNIGITQAQLQSFHSAGDVLPSVEEGLHKVGDTATQGAAAFALLGKGAAAALPAFTMGREAYDAMYDSAVKAGLITTAQAEKAHQAQMAIEDLAIALKTKLAIAMTGNLPVINDLINGLDRLLSKAFEALAWLNKLQGWKDSAAKVEIQVGLGARAVARRAAAGSGLILPIQAQIDEAGDIARSRALINGIDAAAAARNAPVGPSRGAPPPPPNTLDLSHEGRGRHHHDDTAEKLRDAENKTYEAAKQELEGKKAILAAQASMAIDYTDREVISRQLADLEHDEKALEIKHQLAQAELDPKLSAAKKQELETAAAKQLSLNDQLHTLKLLEIRQQSELEAQQLQVQAEDAEFNAQTALLTSREKLAVTAEARRKIELELLDIAYRQKQNDLNHILNDQTPDGGFSHDEGARNQARTDLASLNATHANEVKATINSTAGPMEQFLKSIQDGSEQAKEALQSVEVQGFQSLSQGIIDVITGAKSMGQAFHDIANQIISDLLRIAIQKEIIGPLANMLFGGAGGSAIDALGSSTGFSGFASGGSPPVGVASLVGERGPELFIPKVPGTIIPNHALGGGGQVIYVEVDKSDLFDVHVQASAARVVAGAAPTIMAGAHAQTMRTLTRPRLG
jgi:hypothetical protein